jgi:RecA-family ATPase
MVTSHIIQDGKVYDAETDKLLKTHIEDGITYDQDDDVVTVRALGFKTFAEFADEEPKDWLIEGVIALNEDSTWYGKDGEGKSTLIDDIAIHVASGRDWRGHKFERDETSDPADVNHNECRGVIIFATERAALHRRRLEAYKKRDNLPDDLPITVVDEVINLCDPSCVEIVSDTIYEFERKTNCSVGLVIIDSWSKALGACDENLAATQNYACMNLKKIRERYFLCKFHILTVGHAGKKRQARRTWIGRQKSAYGPSGLD